MYIKLFLHFIHNSVNKKKKYSKHILYFSKPFVHKMQENLDFNSILNSKDVKSQLPLQAKKFKIYASYKYGLPIGQSIFNYNKVLSTLSMSKDGDLLACDCKDKFPKFVYKPHSHVHTGDLDLIENISLCNIMEMGAKLRNATM